jgi:hypothetical protein
MIAWIRLGVLEDVAEWLVQMMMVNCLFLTTPNYFKERDFHSAEEMAETDDHFSSAPHLGFVTERGIGQGESASSLTWTALYDILLE